MDDDSSVNFVLFQVEKIIGAMNSDDDLSVLNHFDMLIKTIPEEIKAASDLKVIEGKVHKILIDENIMRELRLIHKVKAENDTAIEYYYKDRGSDDRLFYKGDLEKELITLREDIRAALGVIICLDNGVNLG